MRTGNPTLNDRAFKGAQITSATDVMTLEGTVNKCIFSIVLTFGGAWWTWTHPTTMKLFWPLLIGALIVSLVITFKKNLAPTLTPVYAVGEGMVLGGISLFAETMYPGIVSQAVFYTFGTFVSLLLVYKSGYIKVTENFKLGIAAATGAILVVYLVSFISSLFGHPMQFLHDSSPLSIGISFVVIGVAALNLVLDFDFIENAAKSKSAPKYMEWYGAFGLLVTLVWLYIEILRLLMKLSSSRN